MIMKKETKKLKFPTSNTYELIDEIVKLLEPFDHCTVLLNFDKKPTIHQVIPAFKFIKNKLEECKPKKARSKQIKKQLINNLETRFNNDVLPRKEFWYG